MCSSDLNWYGVLATGGTPRPVVDKLSLEVARILAVSDIREKLDGLGLAPFVSSADQFAAILKADIAKYAQIIRTADIRVEN